MQVEFDMKSNFELLLIPEAKVESGTFFLPMECNKFFSLCVCVCVLSME